MATVAEKMRKRMSDNPNIRTFNFDFPTDGDVTTRLRDVLETQVDEKYYLSEEKTAKLVAQLDSKAADGEGLKVAVEYSRKTGIGRELVVAHCLSASDWRGLNRNQAQTAVLESEEVRAVLTPERPEKRQNGRRFKEDGEESFTLTAQDKHGVAVGTYPRYRIRKLTPLECWRLQAFTDAQHETVKAAGISDSQRYKMAGNAVTVNVISAIGERLIPLLSEQIGKVQNGGIVI